MDFKYSERDFKEYLDSNKIEYIKRKDGFPNMKYKNFQKMFECHKSLKELEYTQSTTPNTKLNQNFEESSVCGICYDSMKSGVVNLSCGHTICVSCFAQHVRENNNCPYCRYEICSKPKKIIQMPDIMYNSIIDLNFTRKFIQRENMTIEDYIELKVNQSIELLDITDKTSEQTNRIKYCLRKNIMIEIKEMIKDVIHDTEQYYLSFM